jgi:hypothetical protein
MKTNKSYTKRIRVTRRPGQDHFNAKEGGRTKGVKKRSQNLTVSKDIRRRFLSTVSK